MTPSEVLKRLFLWIQYIS